MKIILIGLLLSGVACSVASNTDQVTSDEPVSSFLAEAGGMGFEELDEACGDCVSPEYLLEKYATLVKNLSPEQRKSTQQEFKKIIETQRSTLKQTASHNKFIEVTPQKVDVVIDGYLNRVNSLTP